MTEPEPFHETPPAAGKPGLRAAASARATDLPVGDDPSSPQREHPIITDTQPAAPVREGAYRSRILRPRKHVKRPHHTSYWLAPFLVLFALGVVFAGLALTGRPIGMPVWAVAEVEARINKGLADVTLGTSGRPSVALGAAEVVVDKDWVPRIRLEDVRLLRGSGAALLTLPDIRVALEPREILRGRIRLRSLRIKGARLGLTRMEDGRFDIAAGGPFPLIGFAGIVHGLVDLLDQPALSSLRRIDATDLAITVRDLGADRVWELEGGTVSLENRTRAIVAEVGVRLGAGGGVSEPSSPARSPQADAERGRLFSDPDLTPLPATAHLSLNASRSDGSAKLVVSVTSVAAADIAAQAAPLAFLRVLDAPISGRFTSTLDGNGKLSTLRAALSVAKGALRPVASADPVAFDAAKLAFLYDPSRERIELSALSVQSPSLRVTATGQAYVPGVEQGLPQEMLAQVQFSDVLVDPAGLFTQPVRFDRGSIDLRLRLDPFSVEIGQLALSGGGSKLSLSGRAEAGQGGWQTRADVALNTITLTRLLALWPPTVVPRTRAWVAENVQDGDLSDVHAALRLDPGQEPRFTLGYEYDGADVTFLKSMPPIRAATGYNVIEGRTYTLVVNRGHITPPQGGDIDVAGSVFQVPDITQKPAHAQIDLRTTGSLTATLSLLDQPPFNFIGKANLPVTLGEGVARLRTRLSLPIRQGLHVEDVSFGAAGDVVNVTSTDLIPGRRLASDRLSIVASPEGLSIGGPGTFDGVPFNGTFRQRFGPQGQGTSTITGTAELSASAVKKLKLGLPDWLVSGTGEAALSVDLAPDRAPALELTSNLKGVGLAIPALGWSKPLDSAGSLKVAATLGKPAQISVLTLDAAGLSARGAVSLKPDGTLDKADFSTVKLKGWLDAPVTLTGRGAGTAPGISVNGGSVDLRRLPGGPGGGGGEDVAPIAVALDRLTITESIALTRFRGTIRPGRSGISGDFSGLVNGKTRVAGALVPSAGGAAVRITAADAGAVFSAAGIFPNASGGAMDLSLIPLGPAGTYDGKLRVQDIRIRNAPALAELVNAISVVGLLDQLQASGILFGEIDADFRLTPEAVRIVRASAVGASLGVSAQGVYRIARSMLDLQGVVSPIYFLNGIGSILTRKGEGLFGFNYTVKGKASDPSVSVNPLSILTPGMFREIFRSDPPVR